MRHTRDTHRTRDTHITCDTQNTARGPCGTHGARVTHAARDAHGPRAPRGAPGAGLAGGAREAALLCPSLQPRGPRTARAGAPSPGAWPSTGPDVPGPPGWGVPGEQVLSPSAAGSGVCLHREAGPERGDSARETLNLYQEEPGEGRKRVAGDGSVWEGRRPSVGQVPVETEAERQAEIKHGSAPHLSPLESFCPRKSLTKMKDFFLPRFFYALIPLMILTCEPHTLKNQDSLCLSVVSDTSVHYRKRPQHFTDVRGRACVLHQARDDV